MSLLDSQAPSGSPDFPPQNQSPLKKILPYTTVACLIAIVYIGYVFYSRHESEMQAQAKFEEQQQAARQHAVDTVFGNGEIRFTQFSIDTRLLKRGQTAHLCYGVENATVVKMEPPVEALKPTFMHCMDIAPKVTTTYTITAQDGKGHSKAESLELKVE